MRTLEEIQEKDVIAEERPNAQLLSQVSKTHHEEEQDDAVTS